VSIFGPVCLRKQTLTQQRQTIVDHRTLTFPSSRIAGCLETLFERFTLGQVRIDERYNRKTWGSDEPQETKLTRLIQHAAPPEPLNSPVFAGFVRSGKEPLALPNVVVRGQLSWDFFKASRFLRIKPLNPCRVVDAPD
jgi:hypothetical protein